RGDRHLGRTVEPVGWHLRRGGLDHGGVHPAVPARRARRGAAREVGGLRRVGEGRGSQQRAHHVPPRAAQLHAHAAAHPDAQQLRGDPHARRPRLPGLRHRAERRGRVGLRPQQVALGCHERHLVDLDLPGSGHRARGAGRHAHRRESQRPRRPTAACPAQAGRDARPGGGCRAARRSRRTGRGALMARTQPAVDIRDLRITFDTDGGTVQAVRGVDLEVQPGEVLAIVGESGSGKTVTARSILRLLPETATVKGAVMVGPENVVTVDQRRLRQLRGTAAAMIFQEPSTALNPVYTVGWQLAEGLRAHGKYTKKQARAHAIEMLRRVGIPEPHRRVDDYPHQFSGGQKQRIVIAMALALDPTVIIADEPTTALDATVQAETLDLLRRLRDEDGTAIVLITHNMGVVADLADRVAVMLDGEIVETAPVGELFDAPQHGYTKKLLDAVPRLQITDRRLPETDEPQEPVVVADQLVIEYAGRFGRPAFRAVDRVGFTIAPGEVLGLVGESGSGKTTIGRAIAGLTPVAGGSLRVLGTEMNGVKERVFRRHRKELGFVFQDPATSFNPLRTIA